MFKNIGKKIKTLAVVMFAIELVCVIVFGLAVMLSGDISFAGYNAVRSPLAGRGAAILLGLLIWCVGFLASWIGSFFLYGFGELIDKTSETAQNTRRIADLLSVENFRNAMPVNRRPAEENIRPAEPVQNPAPVQDTAASAYGNIVCPSCGTVNDGSFGFCANCGCKIK